MTAGALFLSRLQFVWVIAWHILLPAFTVGLASFIAVLEGLYLFTRRDLYFRLSNFWTRIFAVSFGMGVVSGITMPFQLGTNWSRYADATANVLSPLFAYEGLMAFFLADREGDARDVRRLDALVAELLVERDVGIAVDGRHHGGFLAGRSEALDRRNFGLPIGITEWRVLLVDVLVGDALRFGNARRILFVVRG